MAYSDQVQSLRAQLRALGEELAADAKAPRAERALLLVDLSLVAHDLCRLQARVRRSLDRPVRGGPDAT